ncbi:MAG TPA: AAA family ATPase [Magnetospirillaceae bacterium]|nr:AAA family ATPase [Magnetospirillaceae bacterium]
MQEGVSGDIKNAVEVLSRIRQSYKQVIVGQEEVFESIIVTLLSRGHLLIEGVPGLAKTMAAHTIAASLGANFARIQCTPDMLPADIIGTQIYNPQTHSFTTQLGPINHQFILVDEINRTSAKTQSALLEAMQERQVSLGGKTYPLPPGFIVMATQNPIEQEGTYLLPEAQLDRFLFKHVITYPTLDEEMQVMKMHEIGASMPEIQPQATIEDIHRVAELARNIQVDDKVLRYIASVVAATRTPDAFNLHDIKSYIEFGASPRASLALVAAGRAAALMTQSSFVTPDHVKPFLQRVLRHRIGLTYQAEAEAITADSIIKHIGDSIIVP